MNVTLEEIPELARDVVNRLSALPQKEHAMILTLEGPLGAGKTTFVQALARELDISETVQSPTYVLMKLYPTTHERFTTLVHIDAYRLESPEEFQTLKPEKFLFDPKALVCIEWPERLGKMLPMINMKLIFLHTEVEENTREIIETK